MSHLMNTYNRLPVAFTHGKGAWLYGDDGKEYLDALAGIAVNGLGHAHPKLVQALADQAGKLIHTSNIYRVREQEQLADRLCAISGMQEVFIGNSGAEANEAALKLVRFYGHKHGNPQAQTIVMRNAWHGRTLATLAATGSEKARQGFDPLPSGFIQVPYNDLEAVERAASADPRVLAIWLEVLQGEGGINIADPTYVRALRELCDRRGWLLMIDEVQSGTGRTGEMWALEHYGVEPDLIVGGKSLGGGLPLASVTGRAELMDAPAPGGLGGTFGGNPAACAAALAVLDVLPGLLPRAREIGETVRARLEQIAPPGADVRGLGPMLALELPEQSPDRAAAVLAAALEQGLVLLTCGLYGNVIRLHVPLVIEAGELERGLTILEQALDGSGGGG